MTTKIYPGDCRDVLPTLEAGSVHCVVTSPPYYGLRDYGTAQWDGGDAGCDHARGLVPVAADDPGIRCSTLDGGKRTTTAQAEARSYRDICGKCGARRIDRQIGLEATPEAYLQTMVAVFREVRRVLRDDGTVWCNMGDGYQDKQLLMMPARLALALQADGWWIRSDIIWHKPGPMPESVRDRPTSAYEHVFLLSKKPRYYFDLNAIRTESGAAPRNVWTIASYPFSEWGETSRRVRVAPDAGVDGMKRKASPDCPVHVDRPAPGASARGGERGGDLPVRSEHTASDPAQAQQGGSVPIVPHHGQAIAPSMLDLLGQPCDLSAIDRSSRNHKTDLVPATSPACSASVQTADGIGRTPASPSPSGSAGHMLGNNSEQDGSDDGRSSRMAFHTARTDHEMELSSASDPSHCTCEWYIEKTEKTSHFATYPPELVERCIRAGTSERGCCAQCGTPWVRVIDVGSRPNENNCNSKSHHYRGVSGGVGQDRRERLDRGWQPGCTHGADVVPATVLDPFAGAGTTLLVADRLQRHAIGIELNADYTTMAMERCRRDAPLFADMAPVPSDDAYDRDMRDLFEEAAD